MIIISDTNIFVDLCNIGLLDSFFLLDEDFRTTKHIMMEIVQSEQQEKIFPYTANGKLLVKSFDLPELILLSEYKSECSSRLSESDVSVIFYGKQTGGVIMTGDNRLRKKAESEGLEVHGILYIILRLFQSSIITSETANYALTKLTETNPWLPKSEIDKIIQTILIEKK